MEVSVDSEWSSLDLLIGRAAGQSAMKGAAALSLSEVLSDPEFVGIREGA